MKSNLPPGVTTNMLPGNTSEDAAWEDFCEWCCNEFAESGLTVGECKMAVRSSIAGMKAIQKDIINLMREVRQDERMACDCEQAMKDEAKERFAAESG